MRVGSPVSPCDRCYPGVDYVASGLCGVKWSRVKRSGVVVLVERASRYSDVAIHQSRISEFAVLSDGRFVTN